MFFGIPYEAAGIEDAVTKQINNTYLRDYELFGIIMFLEENGLVSANMFIKYIYSIVKENCLFLFAYIKSLAMTRISPLVT